MKKSTMFKHPSVKKLLKFSNNKQDILRALRRSEVQKAFISADENGRKTIVDCLPFLEPARRNLRRMSLTFMELPDPLLGDEAVPITTLLSPEVYFLHPSNVPFILTGLSDKYVPEFRLCERYAEINFTLDEMRGLLDKEDRLFDFMLQEDRNTAPMRIGTKRINFLCGSGRYLEIVDEDKKIIFNANFLYALFKYNEQLSNQLVKLASINFAPFYKALIDVAKDIDEINHQNLSDCINKICKIFNCTNDQARIVNELLLRNVILKDLCIAREQHLSIRRQLTCINV